MCMKENAGMTDILDNGANRGRVEADYCLWLSLPGREAFLESARKDAPHLYAWLAGDDKQEFMMIENEMLTALYRSADKVFSGHEVFSYEEFLACARTEAPGLAAWLESDGDPIWVPDKRGFVEQLIDEIENARGVDGCYFGGWEEYWQRTADLDF